MSTNLKNEIFVLQDKVNEDVEFFRVTRATTNTCEIEVLKKNIIHQTEDFQFVEPDKNSGTGMKHRCKVLDLYSLEVKSLGKIAYFWDGKPMKQRSYVFLISF